MHLRGCSWNSCIADLPCCFDGIVRLLSILPPRQVGGVILLLGVAAGGPGQV